MTSEPGNTERTRRCPTCGGRVFPVVQAGRTRELVRGVQLPIPDTFVIPTCESCGDEFFSAASSEELDSILKTELAADLRRWVEALKARYGITQQELEDACRVTRSYLSHVLAGRNPPSGTLVLVLRGFVEVDGMLELALPHLKAKRTTA